MLGFHLIQSKALVSYLLGVFLIAKIIVSRALDNKYSFFWNFFDFWPNIYVQEFQLQSGSEDPAGERNDFDSPGALGEKETDIPDKQTKKTSLFYQRVYQDEFLMA